MSVGQSEKLLNTVETVSMALATIAPKIPTGFEARELTGELLVYRRLLASNQGIAYQANPQDPFQFL